MKKWTDEELKTEALKYNTRSEFAKNSKSAYQAAQKRKILYKICSHMPKHVDQSGEKNPNSKWNFEKLQTEALKYNTRKEFRKNNYGAYQAAFRKKILDKICSHMKSEYWTDKELQEEALKYNTRNEFERNGSGAYQAALKRNILDQICFHMKYLHYPWTNEELQKNALKYKIRIEFAKNSTGAYEAARRKGILDQICSHMKKSSGISNPEKELFDTIKNIYPKTQKLKDTKVKIENKPHIQGFDIDIYIPELRKAIEFDGKYWHSVLGLKRSRPHWPEEDLKNYHKLKDNWFKTKGIKILHIKEEDWLKNKEKCINKCLEFLKNP